MKTKKETELVVLEVFNNYFSANIVKDKLKVNGIESFLEEENVMGLNPLGTVELKVSTHDLKKAKELSAT